MRRRNRIVTAVLTAGVLVGGVLPSAGAAAELSDHYLLGRWTTGSVENCARAEHEQTVFRADGTFATEHAGKALAVGFWQAEDDRLVMHILTTEASLPPAVQEALPGDYHPLDVDGLAFDVADDRFKLVRSIAGQLQGLDMVRCPAS